MIGLVGFLVGGSLVAVGTRAYFRQQGEVKSNVFSAGTLSLKLNSAETAEAVWNIPAGAPGESIGGTVNIRNDGNVEADHIEIQASNEVEGADAIPLDTVLEITVLTYDGVSILDQVADRNSNGIKDLDDLEPVPPGNEPALDGLALTDLGVDHPLVMTVQFNPLLTVSEHQGDSVETTLTVTLNQVAAQ